MKILLTHFKAWATVLTFTGLLMAGSVSAGNQSIGGTITGNVVSADAVKHELTIREEGTQAQRTFRVLNPEILQGLTTGDRVQVNSADEKMAESIIKP